MFFACSSSESTDKTVAHSFRPVTRNFLEQGSLSGIRALRQTFYLQRMKEMPRRVKFWVLSPGNS